MVPRPASRPIILCAYPKTTEQHAIATIVALTGVSERVVAHERPIEWQIDTKYYSADVLIYPWLLDAEESGQCLWETDGHSIEAVVRMFEWSSEASFRALQAWSDKHAKLDCMDPNARDSIQMCVAANAGASSASASPGAPDDLPPRPAWLREVATWCRSGGGSDEEGVGFEYVEVDALRPSVDATLEVDGEEMGMKRLRSALHAHMWPGLVRKKPTANRTARCDDYAGTCGSNAGLGDSHNVAQWMAEHRSVAGACSGADSTSRDSSGQAGVEELHGDGLLSDEAAFLMDSMRGEGSSAEAFEALLVGVRRHQELLGAMSDQERRAGAANLALQLAKMMGLDEDEEDIATAAGAPRSGEPTSP